MDQANIQNEVDFKLNVVDFFGDYTFSEEWLTVTDSNGRSVQVTADELISDEVPISTSQYVKVYYLGQEYWIPKNIHFPM